jgi:formylglycine-generating enzyme required for sulfatase activity
MKKSILAFIVLFISMTSASSQRDSRLDHMHFIPDGEFVEASGGTISLKSFWISNHITNKEFREFWNYAKNNPQEELIWADMSPSKDRKSISQPIIRKVKYSELLKDHLNSNDWPTENYFESHEYNDSPVIGVSENLAKHFCIWKTKMVYDQLNESDRDPVFSYYLPNTLQMKYARTIKPELFTHNEVGFRIIIAE